MWVIELQTSEGYLVHVYEVTGERADVEAFAAKACKRNRRAARFVVRAR